MVCGAEFSLQIVLSIEEIAIYEFTSAACASIADLIAQFWYMFLMRLHRHGIMGLLWLAVDRTFRQLMAAIGIELRRFGVVKATQ